MDSRAIVRTLILLVAAWTETAAAQGIVVSGVVRSESKTGPAIASAEVTLVPGPNPVRTDSMGLFRIRLTEAGPALVTVRAVGFTPLETTVAIDGPDSARVDVVLHRAANVLPAVNVKAARRDYMSPALRGFEDRRAKGFGNFVPDTLLRTMENRQLADILRSQIPGLQIVRTGSRTYVISNRNPKTGAGVLGSKVKGVNNACYATVYLDGVLVFDLASATRLSAADVALQVPDMNDYLVSSLAGIEYYAGEASAPAGYRHSGCGLLLLWTRER